MWRKIAIAYVHIAYLILCQCLHTISVPKRTVPIPCPPIVEYMVLTGYGGKKDLIFVLNRSGNKKVVQSKFLTYGNEKMFSSIQDQASPGGMHVPLQVCQVVRDSVLAMLLRVIYLL